MREYRPSVDINEYDVPSKDPVGTPGKRTLTETVPRARPGQALPGALRNPLSSALGADLDGVRVHADGEAGEAAEQLGAHAFTFGQDIFFGPGKYDPGTPSGQHLIAHEVAHTVQQGALEGAVQHKLEVSAPGDAHELEADRFADAFVNGGAAAAELTPVGRGVVSRAVIQRDDKGTPAPAPEAAAGADEVDPETRRALLDGEYNADGRAEYTEVEIQKGSPPRTVKVFEKFVDAKLQQALEYVVNKLTGGAAVSGKGSGTGDSDAKAVDTHPEWCAKLQLALSLQQPVTKGADKRAAKAQTGRNAKPQWSEDSELAQCILQAFLLEWTRRVNGGKEAPSNVSELYGRAGDSKDNERARMLGGEPGGFNWCGPASERAAALGLMRKGLRFQGKPKILATEVDKLPPPGEGAPAEVQESYRKRVAQLHGLAFQREVTTQGARFLTHWATYKNKDGQHQKRPKPQDKGFRGVAGKEAEILPLEPGDYIYLCAKNSPLSGHVATIIREEWVGPASIDRETTPAGTILSKIYYVSGNAGPAAGGAVRVEQVTRELPPKSFSYFTVAGWGNEYDFRKFKVSTLNGQANQKYVNKMNALFLAATFNDKSSPYYRGGIKAAQFFQANWRSLGAMLPHLGGKASEYEKLLQGYNEEFGLQIAEAQAAVDAYVAKMRSLGLPYHKRDDPTFEKLNRDGAAIPVKVDAVDKMSSIFYGWAFKTKFKGGNPQEIVKWFNDHRYDAAVMEATMGPDEGAKYREALDRFRQAEKVAAAEKHDEAAPATKIEPDDDAAADADASKDQEAKKEYPRSPTGNFSPIEEGHIWVTSILRVGNIDPGKLEGEIRDAQAAAAQGSVEGLDPAAAAPGADAGAIRQQTLESWGLEDLGGTIDSLWPGALEYWEGLGAFG